MSDSGGGALSVEDDQVFEALARLEEARRTVGADDLESAAAVRRAVREVRRLLERERVRRSAEDGLFAEIARLRPDLHHRLDELRRELRRIRSRLRALDERMERPAPYALFEPVRTELGRVVARLRQWRSAETDLVFEATQRDCGAAD